MDLETEELVARYLDPSGRLRTYPAKRRAQQAVLEWLGVRFEAGKRYSEQEVNDILDGAHSFGDPALLRRELFDRGHMERTADGSSYWRA